MEILTDIALCGVGCLLGCALMGLIMHFGGNWPVVKQIKSGFHTSILG